MQSRETQITLVKWTNAGGQTKRANERSFVCRPPAWQRWRNVKSAFWPEFSSSSPSWFLKLPCTPSTRIRRILKTHIFICTYFYTDSCGLGFKPLWGAVLKRCGFGNRFYWFRVNESRFVFKFISFQKYPGNVEGTWMSYHDPKAARRQFCVSKLKAITSSWPLKRELHMNPKTKKQFFLHESAFCSHETSESAHRNRIFLKPLSRVV